MTTNDKPVCYQVRVLLDNNSWGIWHSWDSAESREACISGFDDGCVYEVRGLYARPQPAALQVPDNAACNTLPIDVRGKWYSVPVPVHLHIIALRDALATPPAPEQPETEQKTDAELLAEMEASGALDAFFTFVDGRDEFTRDGMIAAFETSRAEQPKPAGDVEAVVCLAGEPYAHGHCVELQVQIKPGTVFKNGDRLIRLAAQPAQGEGEK